MRLTREQLNAYNGMLHEFQSGAESYFRDLMEAWRAENPDAKVSEAREFCIFAVNETLGIYGLAAEELAAQMFETVCEEEGIEASAEIPEEAVSQEMIENAAHYNAGKLVDGDWAAFVGAEAALTNFYVRHGAYETMKKSCKDNDVRWARVPTGRETCGYCFMLASRGFDYVDEDTAHAGSHRHCDCVVMPGVPGRTKVDGYDPDELYKRWAECRDAAGSKDFREIIKEVETRDWDWLWGNKQKPATQASRVTEFPFGDRVYSGTTFHDSFNSVWASDPKESLDAMYDKLRDAKVPEAAHVWGSVFSKVSIRATEAVKDRNGRVQKGSWYDPGTGRITLETVDRKLEASDVHASLQTLFHEVGHSVDDWLVGRKFGGGQFTPDGRYTRSFTDSGELGNVIMSDWDAILETRVMLKSSDLFDADDGFGERAWDEIDRLGIVGGRDKRNMRVAVDSVGAWIDSQDTATRNRMHDAGIGTRDWFLTASKADLKKAGLPKDLVDEIAALKLPTRKKIETKLKSEWAVDDIFNEMRTYDLIARNDVSDWLEALTDRGYPLGFGHGTSYWKRNGGKDGRMKELSSEAFAELFDACFANHDAWDMMDKYFPSATKWFADKMKEVSEWTPAE